MDIGHILETLKAEAKKNDAFEISDSRFDELVPEHLVDEVMDHMQEFGEWERLPDGFILNHF